MDCDQDADDERQQDAEGDAGNADEPAASRVRRPRRRRRLLRRVRSLARSRNGDFAFAV
jgi:hypothetical protein